MKSKYYPIAFILTITTKLLFAQPIGQTAQGLSVLQGGLWPNKTCSVCWENPMSDNEEEREWVRDAVVGTWERESEFRFTGWGTCTGNSKGIRILINDERPHVDALGKGLDGMRNGMTLNFGFSAWTGCANRNVNCRCRESEEGRRRCIEIIAVHEFGHALGFAHEQNRTDAPMECQNDAQGTNGDWWVTPYDANSIMNYCNPLWNNEGFLSDSDKYGVRFLYGGAGYFTDPIIYGVNTSNKNLYWYKHTGHWNGTAEWGAGSMNHVGSGWRFLRVFSDGDGHLYGIHENGDLHWYNHNGFHDGMVKWGLASGTVVGTAWNNDVATVFSGGQGVLYIMKNNGELYWYKHLGYQDGSARWHPNSGSLVGTGWKNIYAVFSGGGGVIYLVKANGDLAWYKHAGFHNGSNSWYGGYDNIVGNGWNSASQLFSTGNGHIYLVNREDGELYFYKHTGFNSGAATWGNGTYNKIGYNWKNVNAIGLGGWVNHILRFTDVSKVKIIGSLSKGF